MGPEWRRTVIPPRVTMGFPGSLSKLIFTQQTTAACRGPPVSPLGEGNHGLAHTPIRDSLDSR